jgi:hypothetical protein
MNKLALVVALAALVAGGLLWSDARAAREELALQEQAVADLRARLDRLPAGAAPSADVAPPPLSAPAASLDGAAPAPGSLAEELRGLRAELQSQADEIAKLKARAELPGHAQAWDPTEKYYTDVATAAKRLKLDDRQRSELDRLVEETKRELESLHTLPNDEGTTWNEAAKVKFEGEEGVLAFATNLGKIQKFKKTKIPGTNETFGDADKRIRGRAKDRARRLLTPDQQKTWDAAHTDGLFGHGGGEGISMVIGDFVDAGDTVEVVEER